MPKKARSTRSKSPASKRKSSRSPSPAPRKKTLPLTVPKVSVAAGQPRGTRLAFLTAPHARVRTSTTYEEHHRASLSLPAH